MISTSVIRPISLRSRARNAAQGIAVRRKMHVADVGSRSPQCRIITSSLCTCSPSHLFISVHRSQPPIPSSVPSRVHMFVLLYSSVLLKAVVISHNAIEVCSGNRSERISCVELLPQCRAMLSHLSYSCALTTLLVRAWCGGSPDRVYFSAEVTRAKSSAAVAELPKWVFTWFGITLLRYS